MILPASRGLSWFGTVGPLAMRFIGSPTMFERMRATVWAGSAAADEDEIYSASRLSCSRQATPLHSRQPLPHCVQLPDFSPSPTQVPHHTQFLLEWRGHCIIFLHLDLFNSKLVSVLYCICQFFLNLGDFIVCQFEGVFLPRRDFKWLHLHLLAFTCSGTFSQRIGRNSGQLIWLVEDFRTAGFHLGLDVSSHLKEMLGVWFPSRIWLGVLDILGGTWPAPPSPTCFISFILTFHFQCCSSEKRFTGWMLVN